MTDTDFFLQKVNSEGPYFGPKTIEEYLDNIDEYTMKPVFNPPPSSFRKLATTTTKKDFVVFHDHAYLWFLLNIKLKPGYYELQFLTGDLVEIARGRKIIKREEWFFPKEKIYNSWKYLLIDNKVQEIRFYALNPDGSYYKFPSKKFGFFEKRKEQKEQKRIARTIYKQI